VIHLRSFDASNIHIQRITADLTHLQCTFSRKKKKTTLRRIQTLNIYVADSQKMLKVLYEDGNVPLCGKSKSLT